jgi:hypothetical protein
MENKTVYFLLPILVFGLIISHVACGDRSSKIIGLWKLENIMWEPSDEVEMHKKKLNENELKGFNEQEKKVLADDKKRLKDSMLEFYKDKSFIISIGYEKSSGNWTDLEDGRIKLDYKDHHADIAKIEGDKIKITFNGRVLTFAR